MRGRMVQRKPMRRHVMPPCAGTPSPWCVSVGIPVIELDSVTASYRMGFTRRKRLVLDAIRFKIPEGSIAGYLGVNGSGKTTTIKLVVGINAPDAGRITVAGHAAGTDAARRALGYLPENPYFYEYLTPIEALDFYGRLSGLDRATIAKRSD